MSLLAGFLLYVLDRYGDDADRCNVGAVEALISAPKAELEATLEDMLR